MQADTQALYVRLNWHDLATHQGRECIAPLPVTFGRASDNTIVLNSQLVSRQHAVLTAGSGGIMLQDRKNSSGTFVGQECVTQALLCDGNSFRIGPFHFTMTVVPTPPAQVAASAQTSADGREPPEMVATTAPTVDMPDGTQTTTLVTDALTPLASAAPVEEVPGRFFGKLTPTEEALADGPFRQAIVPVGEVRGSQEALLETTYLAIGGGIGSFAWVDGLRICGVPAEQIVVLGPEPKATGRYQRLTRNAQIPFHERIRSNSESCPDNMWGWPSYGLREIWRSLRQGQLRHALRIAVQIFGEPVLTDTYTPRAGDVFNAIDREAGRIGWGQMWHYGRAQALRKTDDGRYVVAYSGINQQGEQEQQFVVANYVHLAMGYPAIRLLADLQEYRQRTQDFKQVVNAYEEHEHIYEHLLEHGGVVLMRGRGIVASQVIQRLYEVRTQNQNKDVVILHVHRSPVPVGHRDWHARRPVKNHVELQPFNWPKACWSGPLRMRLEQANDEQRDQLLNDWGGTTTADRKYWQRIAREGLQEGWYQIYFGQAKRIDRSEQGQLITHLATGGLSEPEVLLTADFIIDCTGMEGALDDNPLLKDMVDCYQLGCNPKGRLRVANDFEIEGMDNGSGRVYASGSSTLGGPHAAADSFLGLQYAALRSVEALEAVHAPWLRRLTPLRSFLQWTRWARGVRP
jgi:pSer/pThr/pTyr-binding forkhead associated (FHA) protein